MLQVRNKMYASLSRMNNFIPKPSLYGKDCQSVIISTATNETDEGIYKYNVVTNTLTLIAKYPSSMSMDLNIHGQFYDHKHELLYLWSDDGVWSYNFATNAFIQISDPNGIFTTAVALSCICCIKNYVHVYGINKFFKYNINNKSIDIFQNHIFIKEKIENPKLIYIEQQDKLYSLGSSFPYFDASTKIMICDTNQFKWQLLSLKMPCDYTSDNFEAILLFNHLIFIFYFELYSGYNKIHCLDIKESKWYDCEYELSKEITNINLSNYIFEINNTIHLLCLNKGIHFTVSSYDLIPQKLICHYQKKIMQYLDAKDKQQNNLPTIPYVLKVLICKYFPVFV